MTHADYERLARRHRVIADLYSRLGQTTDTRLEEWAAPPRQGEGHRWTRGGGLADPDQPEGDDSRSDRREDAAVAKFQERWRKALRQDEHTLTELEWLMRTANPNDRERRLGPSDLQPAQLAADGWCVSCARDRDDKNRPWLEPVADRRYKDACLFCGEWRADNNGAWPPVEFVRYRHATGNKRLTTKVVDAILRRTA